MNKYVLGAILLLILFVLAASLLVVILVTMHYPIIGTGLGIVFTVSVIYAAMVHFAEEILK